MRRHIPNVTILALALAVAGCTGSGSADPTSPPTSSTTMASPSAPTATTASPPLPEATPTPTAAEPTPSPSVAATPTSAFTGGIDPPTEAPEGFSEFSVPPPQDLTEEYAAWVLAVFTRAEDELVRMEVEAPDSPELPEDISVALGSLYAGDSLQLETELAQETVASPPANEAFREEPGSSKISHIELLDATQDCLLLQYVEDVRELLKSGGNPEQLIALFKPKPEIDASSFNATPWQMTNRTVPQDVEGRSCD